MKIRIGELLVQNARELKRSLFLPVRLLRGACIRCILFYQRKLSRHTCLYTPTCSEYTKRCINNYGVFAGGMLGIWRILRCNPLSKGGYDPAPEAFWKMKWLV